MTVVRVVQRRERSTSGDLATSPRWATAIVALGAHAIGSAVCGACLAACQVDERSPGVLQVGVAPNFGGAAGSSASPASNFGGAAGSSASPAPNFGGAAGSSASPAPNTETPGLGRADGAMAAASSEVTQSPSGFATPTPQLDFGNVELRMQAGALRWTVTYSADNVRPSGTLSLSNSNPADFSAQPGTCTQSLDPGASCSVDISFAPQAPGSREARLELESADGGSIGVDLIGNAWPRLTVTRSGPGANSARVSGGLDMDDAGATRLIDCGAVCTALIAPGTELTLEAQPNNGSQSYFGGWTGASNCDGPLRRCSFAVTDSTSIQANFPTLANDLAFVTSISYPATLGSVAAYDARCNELATAAGINTSTGSGYIAALGTSSTSLRDRLQSGVPRGWIRMDGLPFTDDATALFDSNRVYYPVRYDERGAPAGPSIMTGLNLDGTTDTGANCDDWSSNAPDALITAGSPTGGAFGWVAGRSAYECADLWPLLCLGTTHSAPVAVPVRTGKRIWLTSAPYVIGSRTPDQQCELDRPAGVAGARAFLAYTGHAASEVLDPSELYVRPDGIAVGTGAEIAAGKRLTGIWQFGDGSYPGAEIRAISVWTGSQRESSAGTGTETCADWTSRSGSDTGQSGIFTMSEPSWTQGLHTCDITVPLYLYCVER